MPKKIRIAFHDGSNYDYHFIIKELAEKFKIQFTCLGEYTEKYITFTVPIEKEVAGVDKNGTEITNNIYYILQFIHSAKFMASSLSSLINNISEGIHRIKCKFGHHDKKCETCGIKYKYCDCCLEYTNFKDDLLEYKSSNFLIDTHFLTMTMISLFYCSEKVFILVNDITDADYAHAKAVCNDFEIKIFREYHDLFVQSDILLLADVFEKFRKICLQIHELDPAKFLSTPG